MMRHEELSSELVSTLYTVGKSMQKAHFTKDMNATEMAVLQHLLMAEKRRPERPSVRISDISSFLFSSVPAASQVVSKLENRALVERITFPQDRRTVYVRLTESGHNHFVTQHRQVFAAIDRVVDRMGEEKSRALLALLKEVLALTNEEIKTDTEEDPAQ